VWSASNVHQVNGHLELRSINKIEMGSCEVITRSLTIVGPSQEINLGVKRVLGSVSIFGEPTKDQFMSYLKNLEEVGDNGQYSFFLGDTPATPMKAWLQEFIVQKNPTISAEVA